jgi:hypothetical protein
VGRGDARPARSRAPRRWLPSSSVLGFDGYVVAGPEVENIRGRVVDVFELEPPEAKLPCPRCRRIDRVRVVKTDPLLVADLPRHGPDGGERPTLLRVRIRYLSCGDEHTQGCGAEWCHPGTLRHVAKSAHMTVRLARWVVRYGLSESYAKAAARVATFAVLDRIARRPETVRKLVKAYIAWRDDLNLLRPPRWLGIAHIRMLGAPRWALLRIEEDVEKSLLLDVLDNHDLDTLRRRLRAIREGQQRAMADDPATEGVRVVVVPPVAAVRDVVRDELPDADRVLHPDSLTAMAEEVYQRARAGLTDDQPAPHDLGPAVDNFYKVWDGSPEDVSAEYVGWRDALTAPQRVALRELLVTLGTMWPTEPFNFPKYRGVLRRFVPLREELELAVDRRWPQERFETARGYLLYVAGHRINVRERLPEGVSPVLSPGSVLPSIDDGVALTDLRDRLDRMLQGGDHATFDYLFGREPVDTARSNG